MSVFIDMLVTVLIWAIIIRAVLSWFPISPRNPALVVVLQITEPILAPLRRLVPRLGMLDITPMVAIVLLVVLRLVLLG
jgi:YggT family protein